MIIKIHSFSRLVSFFLLITFVFGTFGCKSYIVKRELGIASKPATQSLQTKNTNFYILHVGENMWEIQEVEITDSEISGKLTLMNEIAKELFDTHSYNLNFDKVRIANKNRKFGNQIHIYANEVKQSGEKIQILNSQIKKIQILKTKTNGGIIILTFGLAVGAVYGVVFIAAIIKYG